MGCPAVALPDGQQQYNCWKNESHALNRCPSSATAETTKSVRLAVAPLRGQALLDFASSRTADKTKISYSRCPSSATAGTTKEQL
jgi:hypothetical protein